MQNSQHKQNLQHLDSQRKKSQRSDNLTALVGSEVEPHSIAEGSVRFVGSDIDWAEQNKMLRELRWKQRGQPEKTVWWSSY